MTATPCLAIAPSPDAVPAEREALPAHCWAANEVGTALDISPRSVHILSSARRISQPIHLVLAVRWPVDEIRARLSDGATPRVRCEAGR